MDRPYFHPAAARNTMKKRSNSSNRQSIVNRRDVIKGALNSAGFLLVAPAFLRGQNLNNKLNIALIACGGRALANMNGDGGGGRGKNDPPVPPSENATGIPGEN